MSNMEAQPRSEINLDELDEFNLKSTEIKPGQTESSIDTNVETEISNTSNRLSKILRERYSTESKTGRKIGHLFVETLETHDPQIYRARLKKLQNEFFELRQKMASKTLLDQDKAVLRKQRDDLIAKINPLEIKIQSEYQILGYLMSEYKKHVRVEEYESFMAGFVAEYTFAKACDQKKLTVYYSTEVDDIDRKIDWWIGPISHEDKTEKEEDIYAVQVKTIHFPGMPRGLVTIRTIEELNNYLQALNDGLKQSGKVNQYSMKSYSEQIEKMRKGALTLFRNCVSIKHLQQEGVKRPVKAKPALVVIPGQIAEYNTITGLPSSSYTRSLRNYLPEFFEEAKNV